MKFSDEHVNCTKQIIDEIFRMKNHPLLLDENNLFSREIQHGIKYNPENKIYKTYRLKFKTNRKAKNRFISYSIIPCTEYDNFADSLLEICLSHSRFLIRDYLNVDLKLPKLRYIDLEWIRTCMRYLEQVFRITELLMTNRMDVDGVNYVYFSYSSQLMRYSTDYPNLFELGEVELIDGEMENSDYEEAFFSNMGEEATYNNFKDAMEELMFRIAGHKIRTHYFYRKYGTYYSDILKKEESARIQHGRIPEE